MKAPVLTRHDVRLPGITGQALAIIGAVIARPTDLGAGCPLAAGGDVAGPRKVIDVALPVEAITKVAS